MTMPLNNPVFGQNLQVFDGSASWANSDIAGTAKNLDVTYTAPLSADALYAIIVTNASADSALTVIVKNKITLGGSARYPELARFPVVQNSPDGVVFLAQGWLLSEGGRITITNDGAISGAGAFTAYVHARVV